MVIAILAMHCGCQSSIYDNEESLLNYLKVESNGYVQHKTVNGVDFTLMYRPTDLLVKQEMGGMESTESIESLRKRYDKFLYFNLSMSRNNSELLNTEPKNKNQFTAMVNQLVFGMEEKVYLYTQKKDTIALADYIYPRMYGMTNATTIMFIYPKSEELLKQEYLTFVIQDLGLYTGEVKFKTELDLIINQPKLSFKD
ncbi:hypothetical protein [Subsaximicrobium wynnwilliamsii]|nr:hypothetical protein [Subsaximicrobium wynnwilliamsii]